MNGEKWVSLLQKHDSGVIRLKLRRRELSSTGTATATSKPASTSKSAKIINSGAFDRISENDKGIIVIRRGDAATGKGHQLDSSSESESESDSNERNHNALALIPRPNRLSPNPPLRINGGLVPNDLMALTLSRVNVPSLPQPTPEDTRDSLASTRNIPSESNQRKRRLEERGIIVFDPSAIETSPEIYAPPSTAVIGSSVLPTDADAVTTNPSIRSNPQGQTFKSAEADRVQDSVPASATESIEPDENLRITIPHFLSWGTSQELTMQETFSESSIESIIKILGTVHETLHTMGPSRHGRTYRRSREMPQVELEVEFPSLQTCKSDQTPQTPQTPLEAFGDEQTDKQHPLLIGNASQNDRVRTSLVEACDTKLRYLYTVLNGVLSLYVPLSSPSVSDHPLVQKCWGTFGTIMAVSGLC